MIVEIAFGGIRDIGGGEDRVDQLLGSRFAIAAGDGDEWNVELAAMMQGQLLKGREDVGDENEPVGEIGGNRRDVRGLAGSAAIGGFVDDGVGGAELEGAGGESVAIEIGPLEG